MIVFVKIMLVKLMMNMVEIIVLEVGYDPRSNDNYGSCRGVNGGEGDNYGEIVVVKEMVEVIVIELDVIVVLVKV